MNQKKALLNQLSVFLDLGLNKSAIRRELRTKGVVEVTMYDGVVLPCKTMSDVWRCARFNWKKAQGKSYRSGR
jgi:hypothetical protein